VIGRSRAFHLIGIRSDILGSEEVRESIRPELDAVLLQQEHGLAAMTGGVRRDVQQHSAARHARGVAVREGEGDHLVHLFRPEGIGGPCLPAPRRKGARPSEAPYGREGALRDCG